MMWNNFKKARGSVLQNGRKYLKFQDFMIPILKILRMFGFIPFQIDNEGYISSELSWRTWIYCFLVFALNLTITVSAQLNLIRVIRFREPCDFQAYLKIITLTPQLLGPLPYFLQKNAFIRFFREWRTFQEEFEKVTYSELHLGCQYLKKIATAFVLAVFLLPFCQFIFEDITFSRIIQASAFSLQFVHQLSLISYWYLASKAIRMLAAQYHQFFTREVYLAKGYTESIESYRLLWLSLCRATNDFASSVGATITICLVFHVLYLILDSYRYCILMPEQLRNSRPREIIILLLDSAALLCVLFLYCNIGHNVPKYCSNNMLTTILRIKENSLYPSLDDARINVFLFTFEEYVPVVSVSGFYEINRSLYGGIVSILVTYMIVIFQLKDSI